MKNPTKSIAITSKTTLSLFSAMAMLFSLGNPFEGRGQDGIVLVPHGDVRIQAGIAQPFQQTTSTFPNPNGQDSVSFSGPRGNSGSISYQINQLDGNNLAVAGNAELAKTEFNDSFFKT